MGKSPDSFRAAHKLSSSMANNQKSADKIRPRPSSGIIVEFWASIEVRIPIGYQNETGFHFGLEFILSLLESSPENQASPLQPESPVPA